MPVALPAVAAEAAIAASAEAAAIAAAEAAAVQAAQVAAAEAAAQAAATAAAEQAAATAATNLATNQSILGAIGAGGGAPASAALTGAGTGLEAGAAAGLTSGAPAYGMPAGLEQVAANPLSNALPGQLSPDQLAQLQAGIPQAGPGVQVAGPMEAVPQGVDQVAQGAERFANTTSANFPVEGPAAPELSAMNNPPPTTWPAGSPPPAPSTLENAFTKAMDWVKDNKMTTLSLGMNAAKMFGKSKGGEEKKEYDGILTKYKMSPDFQGRQADPADYQYTPKVYAEGGIMQAYAGGGPVEMMSNANAIGANTGYPMADINKGAYATPYQQPISRNVIGGVSDTGVNPMTGEMSFAGGGIASYKDGGKAAMDYYERMTKPKVASTPDKTDVGIVFDTDPDTRSLDPVTAAIVRQAKVNKRANMQLPSMKRPTPLGRINLAPSGTKPQDGDVTEAARGGIMGLGGYAAGGNPRLLKGPGDGMSDNIPATIAGKQPARLADGEFVVPADVVSHLGNGSTEAGAKKLHQMMTSVRKARTGNPKQGKQINPNKYMPK